MRVPPLSVVGGVVLLSVIAFPGWTNAQSCIEVAAYAVG